MKFYVYRTINIVNGKEYIGVHQSHRINYDNYMGSGVLFIRAIKKYGKDSFVREIVGEFETRSEAEALEAELVTEEYVKLCSNYNLAPGGRGGAGKMKVLFEERSRRWKQAVKRITNEMRKDIGRKSGNTQRDRTKATHPHLAVTAEKNKNNKERSKKLSLKMIQRWIDNREKMMEVVMKNASKNRGKTKENCEWRRRQAEKISGENNPMKREDVLEKFIGKTKDNCEWRARQAQSIKEAQAEFSEEKKKEIAAKISAKSSGENNAMHGKKLEDSPVSKYSNEQRLKVINLFKEGHSRKEISKITGVNYQTVKICIRKRNEIIMLINNNEL